MRDKEEFWDELLAQMETGEVIPIVGPELLNAPQGNSASSLYELAARRLLAKYGLVGRAADDDENPDAAAVPLRRHHELNDAVSALVRTGRRVQDLYRPIADLLKALAESAEPPTLQPLRDLASIPAFTLFVTVTPDDLLARSIDAVRYSGSARTEHIVFAPKLSSGAAADVPEFRSSGWNGVCYLFGKASPSPFAYAIHDEDTLEFIHKLQVHGADSMRTMFSLLRTQHLLLIGCGFNDWLSRFFIRLANTQRLADNRSKHEFLVGDAEAADGNLTLFLERFSPDTWVSPGNARDFTAELARRWHERHPLPRVDEAPATPERSAVRPDDGIFISYSRADISAARELFAGLWELGADTIWFDKAALAPGDGFEQKIRSAIAKCWLFVPLISAHTEAREEGFFREEWTLAGERLRRIQGRKFILPVVIDPDYDGNASRYSLVHDCFLPAHFGHAPAGHLDDDLRTELTRLIREHRTRGAP